MSEAAQAGPAGTIVALRHVAKIFANGTRALEDMSLTVERGEFLCLLGPSGCGKSTVLRIIAGLGEPSAGTVDWPAGPPAPGEIGFVFQDPTLMPWATVFGNAYLPLKLRGLSKSAARNDVLAALGAVGLADVADAFPRELSGGMRMRVSIARTLVTKPKLLLLDEPFGALDEITRHRLNDDLRGLWRQTGITVIFVTHSVFESAYLASRIVVMKGQPGQVHADLPLAPAAVRDANYRTSEAYRATTERVSRALQEAMRLGGGDARA